MILHLIYIIAAIFAVLMFMRWVENRDQVGFRITYGDKRSEIIPYDASREQIIQAAHKAGIPLTASDRRPLFFTH